jgi:uncharacterized membrane protein
MNLLSKIFIIVVLCAVAAVYVILPYINGMTGPYRVITYTTQKLVVPEENNDLKYQPLFDRNGNVIK